MIPHFNGREFDGEVAIVTGAGLNTGSLIARTLAAAGAAVLVNYKRAGEAAAATIAAIEAAAGRAITAQGDVCDREDVRRFVGLAADQLGVPTILVNNANVRSFRPLMETTPDEWRQTLAPTPARRATISA